MSRPDILPKVVPHYEYEESVHPDEIRVSFADGSTAVYDIRRTMPHPVMMKSRKIMDNWKQGYVNNPKRRRKA